MRKNKNNKRQLVHPEGKEGVTMDKGIYELVEISILKYLNVVKECSHKEMTLAVIEDFEQDDVFFDGSVEWHVEWVKLDMESRKIVLRSLENSAIKFSLV